MKMYEGMKKEKSFSGSHERLPIGGYICKILDTEEVQYAWGDVLIIRFDIADGDYKDFYKKLYKNDTREIKNWKGNYRLNIPTSKSKYPESDIRGFNNFIYCLEESNTGFTFDCEKLDALKNKKVGILFRNAEFEKTDGTTDFFTEACSFVDVSVIKSGDFAIPKDRMLKKKNNDEPLIAKPSLSETVENDEDDEDLPF